jgi:hypothetical protein
VNAAQGYAWIADEGGLYLFQGGSFPSRPVSYYQQPDWQRINWAAANTVEVVDDKNNKRVIVKAPLDGSTVANYQLTFDYTDGVDPESVKYSLDNISGYNIGAIAMVVNNQTKHSEVWMGKATAGQVIRRNDGTEANPYRDISAAISSLYETAILPGLDSMDRGQVHAHHGDHIRVRGSGSLGLTVWGLDHTKSIVPAASPLSLATSPGFEYMVRYSMLSEYASIQFASNALDANWVLSKISHYFTRHVPQR